MIRVAQQTAGALRGMQRKHALAVVAVVAVVLGWFAVQDPRGGSDV